MTQKPNHEIILRVKPSSDGKNPLESRLEQARTRFRTQPINYSSPIGEGIIAGNITYPLGNEGVNRFLRDLEEWRAGTSNFLTSNGVSEEYLTPLRITSEGLGVSYSKLISHARNLKSNGYSKNQRRAVFTDCYEANQSAQASENPENYVPEMATKQAY